MGKVDISFKVLGDRSPPTMVRLFGHLPDAEFESVRPIDKEVAVGPFAVDQAFLVLGRNGEKWIEHFESEMVVSRDDMSKVLRRAVALSYKEDLPVWTSVVLVSRYHAPPRELADVISEERGGLNISLKVRIVELWKQPSSAILDGDVLEALPMVGAMQATPEELETAMRRIQAVEDREIRSQLGAEFAIWAGLNYNKIEVEEFRGRFRMVTAIDLWNASPVGQEALAAGRQLMEEKAREKGLQEGRQEGLHLGLQEGREEGREEGRQEGRQEGALESAREQLALLCETRFPGLLDAEAIARLGGLEAVRSIFRAAVIARDAGEVRAAISQLPG